MPPVWLLLPVVAAVGAVELAVLAIVLRSQGKSFPLPSWWRRATVRQQRLAYLAIGWELVAVTILLWSIEPEHELTTTLRVVRGLGSLVAWGILIWVSASIVRRRSTRT
jgi:hypothetical protein